MNDYMTSPVTPIVAGVVAVAIIVGIFIRVASVRRKREREEAARREQRRKAQEALDRLREREVEERRTRTVNSLQRAAESVRSKPFPRRKDSSAKRPSVPAPGRPGFRTDAPSRRNDYDDSLPFIGSLIAADMLYPDPTPSRDDTPSPTPDPTPSPSSDSSSNSSSWGGDSGGGGSYGGDSGGGFSGGDSGSF